MVSYARVWSIESKAPLMLLFLQYAIFSATLIKTSWINLWLVKPFWAREVNLFITDLSLLFTALEITLYRHPKRKIGRHFFMSHASPFLGISFIIDELKLTVKVPLRNTVLAYLWRGLRNIFQYRVINLVLNPSKPAAEFLFAPSIAESSSAIDRLWGLRIYKKYNLMV